MKIDMELFWHKLENMGDMDTIILATSKDDIVTARPIGAVRYDDSILVRTDNESEKARHLSANANAAVCMESYYLKCKARILGSCSEQGNPEIQKARDIYSKRWPDAFKEADTFLSNNEVFILITPTKISQWVYEGDNIEGLFHLDLENGDTER